MEAIAIALHSAFNFMSLWLTIPGLVFSFLVIRHWGPSVFQHLRRKMKEGTFTTNDMLIGGIVCSFVGSFGDQTYWGGAWSADYTFSEYTGILFWAGVFSNVPFRNVAILVAGYLHSVAYYRTIMDQSEAHRKANLILFWSCAAASVVMVILTLIRWSNWSDGL